MYKKSLNIVMIKTCTTILIYTHQDPCVCVQGESMWLHKELIGGLLKKSRTLYPVVEYAYTCTPSYPSGQIGLIMCSKDTVRGGGLLC